MSIADDAPGALRARADFQAIDDAEGLSAAPALSAIRPELWATLHHLGFTGGNVLVQGDGADALLGLPGADVPGLSSISATVGSTRNRPPTGVAPFRGGMGAYDAVVSVLPMVDVELNTTAAIVQRTITHAALILATLKMARPGGLAAVVTNHLTLDANTPNARMAMELLGDLLGAVRLPSAALRPQMPGTDAVTDLLLFARRDGDQPSRSRDFIDTVHVPLDGRHIRLNTYFDQHPEHALGEIGAIHQTTGRPILTVTGRPGRMPTELHQALGHIVATATYDCLVRAPADYESAMQVLAVHKEVKIPHAADPLRNAMRALTTLRAQRRAGPGAEGPTLT